jgi:hypothetical protein
VVETVVNKEEIPMVPWLWFWMPQFQFPAIHFPFSGAVAQRIEPNTNWFFDAIRPWAGNGRIEQQAFDVASYGRQLGLITDLLLDLASQQDAQTPQGKEALLRLAEIRARIEALKTT